MQILNKPRWSPYWVGGGIGVLSWITFGGMDKALGVSTTFVRFMGWLESLVAEAHVRGAPYFVKYLGTAEAPKPVWEWQFSLVVFLVLGAWVAARLAGSRFKEEVPDRWRERFGPSQAKRNLGAFAGGVILMFGARLAGGCTSGHGISGGLQLAVSSWVFLIALFVAGIAAAKIIYTGKGGGHV